MSKKFDPLWKGPVEDGITFSLLNDYLECKERFRLKVVEGIVEDEGLSAPLEFGSMWHEAEEAYAAKKDWKRAINRYKDRLIARHRSEQADVIKLANTCHACFPEYVKHWAKHGDEARRKPLLQEVSFRVPIKLPSGRPITLRGKWDSVFALTSRRKEVWLQENKAKGSIDEEGIAHTLFANLQTMIYLFALRESSRQKTGYLPDGTRPSDIAGVIYNVVRRPLADIYSIRQRKDESAEAFYARLQEEDISRHPNKYFYRWKVCVRKPDMDHFCKTTMFPLLEELLDWWEWVSAHPEDPFAPGNRLHRQSPWGTYNSLDRGFRGSYFRYLTTGSTAGLVKISTLYPELDEES